jgi:3-phenylpropionate/cinnamic acid dioxygenase small subunit
MDVGKELAEIQERLRIIEDERAILRIMYRYAHCVDYGLEDEFLDLFTDDAVRTAQLKHGAVSVDCKGRAELAVHIGEHTRAPDAYHKHVMSNPMITMVGDDVAKVESYSMRFDERGSEAVILSFGRYFDTLVRQDRAWRFKERRSEVEYSLPQVRLDRTPA